MINWGKGYYISEHFAILKVTLSPPVARKSILWPNKVPFFGQNFKLQCALIPEFPTR